MAIDYDSLPEGWMDNPPKKKGKKTSSKSKNKARRNTPKASTRRGKRRKYRKNPPRVTDAITDTLTAVGGFVAAPMLRDRIVPMLGIDIPAVINPILTGVASYFLGWAAGTLVSKSVAKQIMVGGFVKATSEILINELNLPLGEYNIGGPSIPFTYNNPTLSVNGQACIPVKNGPMPNMNENYFSSPFENGYMY